MRGLTLVRRSFQPGRSIFFVSVYLDHAATTPVRREVLEAMLPFLTERFGNSTGAHAAGRAARRAVDDAREEISTLLGVDAGEVVFTSGGTEGDNLAVRTGAARGRLLVSGIEHHGVLAPAEAVGAALLPVTADGVIDLSALVDLLDESVGAVSVIAVNNETGVVQPIDEVANLVRRHAPRALLHTDAVQALCWLPMEPLTAVTDMLTLSAHKFGGPQGVGVLVVRAPAGPVVPQILGGGQERERRSGTHNVAGIVGMAVAMRAATEERVALVDRASRLRNRLVETVLGATAGRVIETVRRSSTAAGFAHLTVLGVESEALLVLLDDAGVAASAGASCSSGALEPSHVLTAMGRSRADASSGLRLTLGHTTTDHDVELAGKAIVDSVSRLQVAA